jgi:hypothetical protein
VNRPPLQQLLGGLGSIAQSGLFRAAVRNWWASVPIGLVVWHSVQKRRKAGTLNTMGVVTDITPVVLLVGGLITMNHILEEREAKPAKPSLIPTGMPITDAQFTPQEGAHPVVAFTEAAPPPAPAPPAATPVAMTIQDDNPYG